MKNAIPLFPAVDLEQTKRFYARLGFVVKEQTNGPKPLIRLERDSIEIEFYFEPGLNPFKNTFLETVMVDNAEALAQDLQLRFIPEDTECCGWVLPQKNGEIHLVDTNGNLLIMKKRVAA